MHPPPIINIQEIRGLMTQIMSAFEGIELKELEDDEQENIALASAITLLMLRQMQTNGKNYIPTAIDFVRQVQFPYFDGEGEVQFISKIDQEVIEQYISDISQPTARAALAIQSKVNSHEDAHLILAMLHFSMLILSNTLNPATSRHLIINLLKDES